MIVRSNGKKYGPGLNFMGTDNHDALRRHQVAGNLKNYVGLLTAEFIWLARSELFLLKLLKLVLFFDSIFFEKFFDFLSRIFLLEFFRVEFSKFFSGSFFRDDLSWPEREMHFFGDASEKSCGYVISHAEDCTLF